MEYLLIIFSLLIGALLLWKVPFPVMRRTASNDRNRKLSLIIPARNEEENLLRLLSSIEQQDDAIHEVIVVDDHSTDRTGNVAKSFGAKVICPGPLPEGWFGKSWACWNGANQATGDIFLFLDADTEMEAEGIVKILASFPGQDRVMAIHPYHTISAAYENLSGIFNLVTMMGIGGFHVLQKRIKPAGAFGQCLVCRKDDYFKVGGHEEIRGELLENMELGKRFLKLGYGIDCFGGKGTVSMRMYPEGVKELINGWKKSFASGADATNPFLLFLIIIWITGGVSVSLMLPQNFESLKVLFITASLYLLFAMEFFWMLRRAGNFSLWAAALFPVMLFFFVAVFIFSIFQTYFKRTVSWKDRSISVEKRKGG
ncbi:glycosyltransferase [Pseudalkalibacillus caeni]|uniref:4,4'-diaponeurosporenoate glycosyltransferase n=1 Tax=Exobacillus caeni TaxID=2574798 RepID=A0A5R9F060_9BACL|nr:glycosyltransferase [Pseudalkalibacillus caeni]TLS36079.1 glycosyltransferase [Pseudalkalibacillus caeni]